MFEDMPPRTLNPNMRWIWMVRGVFATVVLAAATSGAVMIVRTATDAPMVWWPTVVVTVIGLVTAVAWALAAWPRWRWGVTDVALTLHHGVLTHHVVALPFFRIQHIDANQGPLDRLLGMSQLQVHTASISASLPGIDADDANELRRELLARAAKAAAEAATDGSVDAV